MRPHLQKVLLVSLMLSEYDDDQDAVRRLPEYHALIEKYRRQAEIRFGPDSLDKD